MKIYLEFLLFIFIPMIIFILWYFWNNWSKKKLLKQYNPEEDLGRLADKKRNKNLVYDGKERKGGEQYFRDAKGRERRFEEKSNVSNRYDEPVKSELLPTASSIDDRKTSNSNRKNGRSIGRLLKRRRRTKG